MLVLYGPFSHSYCYSVNYNINKTHPFTNITCYGLFIVFLWEDGCVLIYKLNWYCSCLCSRCPWPPPSFPSLAVLILQQAKSGWQPENNATVCIYCKCNRTNVCHSTVKQDPRCVGTLTDNPAPMPPFLQSGMLTFVTIVGPNFDDVNFMWFMMSL